MYGPIQLTVPCGSVELIANIIGLGPSGNFTIRAPLNTLSAESWSNADEDLFLEVQTMLLVSVNNYLETVHLYSTLKTMTLSCFPEVFAFFLFVFFLFCSLCFFPFLFFSFLFFSFLFFSFLFFSFLFFSFLFFSFLFFSFLFFSFLFFSFLFFSFLLLFFSFFFFFFFLKKIILLTHLSCRELLSQ